MTTLKTLINAVHVMSATKLADIYVIEGNL